MYDDNPTVTEFGCFANATYSSDYTRRYLLIVPLAHENAARGVTVHFIMLNPSTATHEKTDPTITRCIGFAKALCASELRITNISALRSTDPRGIIGDAVDDENINTIAHSADVAGFNICAWGGPYSPKALRETVSRLSAAVVHRLSIVLDTPPLCLATAKGGQPRHPLYLKSDSRPRVWTP